LSSVESFESKEFALLEKEVKLDRQELLDEYRIIELMRFKYLSEYLSANCFPRSRMLLTLLLGDSEPVCM